MRSLDCRATRTAKRFKRPASGEQQPDIHTCSDHCITHGKTPEINWLQQPPSLR